MTLELLIRTQNMLFWILYNFREFLNPLGDYSQNRWSFGVEDPVVDFLSRIFGHVLVDLAADQKLRVFLDFLLVNYVLS